MSMTEPNWLGRPTQNSPVPDVNQLGATGLIHVGLHRADPRRYFFACRKYREIHNVANVNHLLHLNKLCIFRFIFGSAKFWMLGTLKIPIYFLVVLRSHPRAVASIRVQSLLCAGSSPGKLAFFITMIVNGNVSVDSYSFRQQKHNVYICCAKIVKFHCLNNAQS